MTEVNANDPMEPTSQDETPDQCFDCGGYHGAEEPAAWPTITVDLDPGDAENGPAPDVCDVSICPACVRRREFLQGLTLDRVVKVYTGRPGCGCGCRGTYSTNRATMSRVLSAIKNAPPEEVRFDVDVVAWETETRYRWVYLR